MEHSVYQTLAEAPYKHHLVSSFWLPHFTEEVGTERLSYLPKAPELVSNRWDSKQQCLLSPRR